jgi:hypothetical protein
VVRFTFETVEGLKMLEGQKDGAEEQADSTEQGAQHSKDTSG